MPQWTLSVAAGEGQCIAPAPTFFVGVPDVLLDSCSPPPLHYRRAAQLADGAGRFAHTVIK